MFDVNSVPKALMLDHEGENNIVSFQFDFSDWVEKYGEGTFYIKHQRSTDTNPYVVTGLTILNNIATWTINNVDTGVNGIGEAECNYEGVGFHKKSDKIKTHTRKALVGTAVTPNPYQDWVDTMQEYAEATQRYANNAEESATAAAASALAAAEVFLFTDSNSDGNIVISYAERSV